MTDGHRPHSFQPLGPMHVLTRRTLDRRRLLRGAGAALGLPLLSSMTAGLEGVPDLPRRLVFVYVPNGVIGDAWQLPHERPAEGEPAQKRRRLPTGSRALDALSPTLAPLEPLRERLLVVSGLTHDKGRANGDGPGDHARAAGTWLTGCQPFKGDGTRLSIGPSADQLAASVLGRRTRLESLVLGAEGGRLSGQCDSGYPCAYSNTISWRTPHTPVPKQTDPGQVFDALVGAGRPGESADERAARLATRASVLDLLREDARRLEGGLGSADRQKLEEYLEAVRATERRVQRLTEDGPARLDGIERPEDPNEHGERVAVLFELVALALESDATRVVTLMIANEGSGRSYRSIGVRQGHHGLSHHKGDEEKIEKLRKVNHHHVTLLEPFLRRLATPREGEGALLDHAAVVYGSGLSDGNRHRHEELPLLVAGGLGGVLGTGRSVRVERETPMANLWRTLLEGVGVHTERLGDSTGTLDLRGPA